MTNSRSLLKLMSKLVMPSNHLILCHPHFLQPSIYPSIRVFSNKSVLCIRWPKYWSFSFSISPSNEYSGLISFRMDWLDFLAVQGTLKSLLEHHSSKASILWHSAFFIVQLSHPYMTTGWGLRGLDFVNSVMKKDPQIWSYTENFIHPRPPSGCFSSGLCSPSIRPLDYPSIALFNFISVFIPVYPPSYSIFYLI